MLQWCVPLQTSYLLGFCFLKVLSISQRTSRIQPLTWQVSLVAEPVFTTATASGLLLALLLARALET